MIAASFSFLKRLAAVAASCPSTSFAAAVFFFKTTRLGLTSSIWIGMIFKSILMRMRICRTRRKYKSLSKLSLQSLNRNQGHGSGSRSRIKIKDQDLRSASRITFRLRDRGWKIPLILLPSVQCSSSGVEAAVAELPRSGRCSSSQLNSYSSAFWPGRLPNIIFVLTGNYQCLQHVTCMRVS